MLFNKSQTVLINHIFLAILLFLDLIKILIIVEVLLSWLQLLGIVVRIGFIESITRPIYDYVKKIIPTTFGMLDFTPIVVLLLLQVAYAIILSINPGVIFLLP